MTATAPPRPPEGSRRLPIAAPAAPPRTLALRAGDWVEVRGAAEILATLDERGTLDDLPFMPEMLQFCGRRHRVFKRADKTCDTIHYSGSRRMYDTVHLEGARCDGAGHGGCQAGCLTFWKEAWLKRVDPAAPVAGDGVPAEAGDVAQLAATTRRAPEPGDAAVRYRCQATDLLRASTPMRWWDVRQYVRDVRSGNVRVSDVLRAAMFRVFLRMLKLRGYRLWMAAYERLRARGAVRPFPFLEGTLRQTPQAALHLQPGELVRVKPKEEILRTLNVRNRNRGLSFDPEMVRYCGAVLRVRGHVERLIEEGSGRMVTLANDCVILEGAYCRAEYSDKRLFCPRSLFPFWREIWLDRVAAGEGAVPAQEAGDPACAAQP